MKRPITFAERQFLLNAEALMNLAEHDEQLSWAIIHELCELRNHVHVRLFDYYLPFETFKGMIEPWVLLEERRHSFESE